MKKRKGYKKIVVDDVEYQYCVTNQGIGYHNPHGIIVYDSNERKYTIPELYSIGIPDEYLKDRDGNAVWRGKHDECWIGKRQVAWVIKNIINGNLP